VRLENIPKQVGVTGNMVKSLMCSRNVAFSTDFQSACFPGFLSLGRIHQGGRIERSRQSSIISITRDGKSIAIILNHEVLMLSCVSAPEPRLHVIGDTIQSALMERTAKGGILRIIRNTIQFGLMRRNPEGEILQIIRTTIYSAQLRSYTVGGILRPELLHPRCPKNGVSATKRLLKRPAGKHSANDTCVRRLKESVARTIHTAT
jgi:hypothetical protein